MALPQTTVAFRSPHVLNPNPVIQTMKYQTTNLLCALALVSCNKSETTTSSTPQPAASAPSAALKAVIDASATGEAKAIHTARESAKPGDAITVTGRIMGGKSPFVEGRSAFILGDPSLLTPCNEHPDDACPTPWDNCCDSKENKKIGTATIQVVDAEGRVLKEPIEGVEGIQKLSRLTISGTVAAGSTPELLVINATAIDPAP
jgi:hypothetical protein